MESKIAPGSKIAPEPFRSKKDRLPAGTLVLGVVTIFLIVSFALLYRQSIAFKRMERTQAEVNDTLMSKIGNLEQINKFEMKHFKNKGGLNHVLPEPNRVR